MDETFKIVMPASLSILKIFFFSIELTDCKTAATGVDCIHQVSTWPSLVTESEKHKTGCDIGKGWIQVGEWASANVDALKKIF